MDHVLRGLEFGPRGRTDCFGAPEQSARPLPIGFRRSNGAKALQCDADHVSSAEVVGKEQALVQSDSSVFDPILVQGREAEIAQRDDHPEGRSELSLESEAFAAEIPGAGEVALLE